jgi:hypothetical protein
MYELQPSRRLASFLFRGRELLVALALAASVLACSQGPAWVRTPYGAELSPEPALFGVGSHEEESFAKARAVHNLDQAWRSFIRLLDLELYGSDIEKSGRLPLPPWSGEGLPRQGVSFPDQ